MYGTNVESNSEGFSPAETGIIENVEIVNISFNEEANRLDIELKQSNGSSVKHSEFEANPSFGDVNAQAENTSRRIKHIVTKFMPEEEFIIDNVNSFSEYAKKVVEKTKGRYEGKKFRALFIYRGKYVDFPKYPNFLESMDVPKEKTSIFISAYNKSKLTQTTPDQEEAVKAALAATGKEDGLPF